MGEVADTEQESWRVRQGGEGGIRGEVGIGKAGAEAQCTFLRNVREVHVVGLQEE